MTVLSTRISPDPVSDPLLTSAAYASVETTDIPGDTGTDASIALGQSASGMIDPGSDQDWYAIDVVAGQYYSISLDGDETSDHTLQNPFLFLYDSTGQRIRANNDFYDPNEPDRSHLYSRMRFTADEDARLYIRAGSYIGSTGAYVLSVIDPYITGTDEADTLTGTELGDSMRGGTGADTINGLAGNDSLEGGDGADLITGNNGNDTILGGAMADTIHAGEGHDTVKGGLGADTVTLGSGDDRFRDTDQGGANGRDEVHGDGGHDYIEGGGGNDLLFGGDGNDLIYGEAGNDRIEGNAGSDTLNGGDGDDRIWGGDGFDYIRGDSGNDRIFGDADEDYLYGDDGNDSLHGGTGHDTIYGGAGDDVIFAGGGNDWVYAGGGNDTVTGGGGRDTVYLDDGDDLFLDGAQGGYQGSDEIHGGAGDDTIQLGGGDDTVWGGVGSDVFVLMADNGTDLTRDFQFGADRIDVSAWGITGIEELEIENWIRVFDDFDNGIGWYAWGFTIRAVGDDQNSFTFESEDDASYPDTQEPAAEDFIFAIA